jgi:hypothetical protein
MFRMLRRQKGKRSVDARKDVENRSCARRRS